MPTTLQDIINARDANNKTLARIPKLKTIPANLALPAPEVRSLTSTRVLPSFNLDANIKQSASNTAASRTLSALTQQDSPQVKVAEQARRTPRNIINDRPIQLPDANKPQGFVGPKPERVLSQAAFDKFIGNKPEFQTVTGSKGSISQRIAAATPDIVKKGASVIGKAAVPGALLLPAVPAVQTFNDPNATGTQKIDSGVRAASEIGGGIAGAALLPKIAAGVATVAKFPLPPQLKIPLTLAGAVLGSLAGSAGADSLLSEKSDQVPISDSRQDIPVEGSNAIPDFPQFTAPVAQASRGGQGGGFGRSAASQNNSLLGIADRRLSENRNLLARPGAVEIIRGLNRSAFLGDGVEVSLEPGAEIGRERFGRAFGQPGVAATELKTDAQRDVAGLNLAGRLAAASNRLPSFAQIQGALAQQALSGSPEEVEQALAQAETLGQLKSALSGKAKKQAGQFDLERKRLSEILADPETDDKERSVALKRAQEIKFIESALGE